MYTHTYNSFLFLVSSSVYIVLINDNNNESFSAVGTYIITTIK